MIMFTMAMFLFQIISRYTVYTTKMPAIGETLDLYSFISDKVYDAIF